MALHQTGRSANSLAKEYNVSTSTVTKWVNQADLENTDKLSSRERMLIKENQRLKEEIDILKRERCCWQKKIIRQRRIAVLKVVAVNLKAKHRITNILKVLKIPSSTYYGYCHWQPSQSACRRQLIKRQLLATWLKHPMYGYPRLTLALNQTANLKVGQKLVYRLMQELGIKSRMLKKTNKLQTHTDYEQRPNLIKQLADQTGVLLTDITYIPVKYDWIYLASIYNPKTRQVVAYKMNEQMTKELATAPIKMILARDTLPSIIHSDMGSQYTSELFENTLLAAGIKHSYSHKSCPGDNAHIESFHSILKHKYVNSQNFQNSYEAIAGLDQYIRWYNSDRISLVA